MLRLCTFGGLSVQGTSFDAAARRRPLAVLALLAVAGERGLSREKLVGYLWPESDEERARNSLSQVLSSLRRDFGSEHVILGSVELRLNPDVVTSDVQAFTERLDAGDDEGALALYAGPFLDGVFLREAPEFERWADQERRRLHVARLEAAERLAAAAATRGDHPGAVRWWRLRAQAEPLDSRAALGLMQSLASSGDAASAIRHFRAHEELLRDELGVAVDPAIGALAASLVPMVSPAPNEHASRYSPAATSPAGAGPLTDPVSRRRMIRRTRVTVGLAAAAVAVVPVVHMATASGDTAPVAKPGTSLVLGSHTQATRLVDTLAMDVAISPDGKAIAYAAGTPGQSRIFVQSLSSSSAINVSSAVSGDHRWPRWSPDGSTIAFTAGSRPPKVVVVPAFGGQPRVVVDSAFCQAWSPDGKQLAYSFQRVIWTIPANGGTQRKISDFGSCPNWSPDGRRLALVRGGTGLYLGITGFGYFGGVEPSAIWVMDSDGRDAHAITDSTYLAVSPVWLPAGGGLLFVSNRDGVRDVYRQRLNAEGRAIGTPERITTGAHVWTFTLSSDGSTIAYSTLKEKGSIWRAPITDSLTPFSEAHEVTQTNQPIESFDISHDGRWLAYDSYRDGRSRLFKVALDGRVAIGAPIQLTRDSTDDYYPQWSPDDKEIVFYRATHTEERVMLMQADGLDVRRVTADSTACCESYPDWAPDGRSLVFIRAKPGGRGRDAFVVRRLIDGRWSSPLMINHPTKDMGWIARWSSGGHDLAIPGAGISGIGLQPVAGGDMRPVLRGSELPDLVGPPRYVGWGPDPHDLYFQTYDTTRVASYWRIRLPDGKPQRILRLTDRMKPGSTQFDTDGKSIFFRVAANDGDVFIGTLRWR